MANELQIGQIVAQVEYSTTMPGQGEPIGPDLPESLSVNLSGGPRFSTSITKRRDGSELRYIRFAKPIRAYSLAIDAQSSVELSDLRNIFFASSGAVGSFRVKNFIDYSLSYEPIGYGDGSTQAFQIIKTYSGGGKSFSNNITKIIGGSVSVYVCSDTAGSLPSVDENDDYSIDYETGVITFISAPELNACIRVSCEFAIRSRFSSDSIPIVLHGPDSSSVDSVELVEVRS